MNRKYWVLLAVAAVVYIIYHIVTLIYSPFPWFDEVTFSSITESYIKNHTFFEDSRIIAIPEQKLNYGPIYFIWQSLVVNTFGFGIFNFRISNLLFGLIDLFLIYKICKKLNFKTIAAVVAVILVALEPNFNQFLHSGRMDFMSLFFFLLSYLTFSSIDFRNKPLAATLALATGVLLASAMLTTPRIIFAFSVYVFYFLYEIATDKDKNRLQTLLKYALIGLAFAAVYYLWIVTTFGSIANYIYNNTHASYMKEHVGMGGKIAIRYNLFIYLFAFIAFFALIKSSKLAAHLPLVLFTMPAIAAFIGIVTGGLSGRYFALVLPFTMLIIAGVTIDIYSRPVLRYITYTIAALFGIVFIFKGTYILATIPQHNPYTNEKIISGYITPNSSIAGDFQYYYVARHNNCSFLSIEDNGTNEEKIKYFLDHKVQYIILNKDNRGREGYEQAFLNAHYEPAVFVEDKNYSGFFSKILKKLPYRISDSYACYIYKYKG